MSKYQNIDEISERIGKITRQKGWDKTWSRGGCYLHLESSEFIEALRGKGDTSPEEEAGDVIVALFSMLECYDIKPSEVFEILEGRILPDLEE